MEYLALELQKYYLRVKNRLIFNNGMSLNQMALEMWTELGNADMDPSILSKVINGERLFSGRQLKAFCKILSLNTNFEYLLEESIGKDLSFRHFGFEIASEDYEEIVADSLTKDFILKEIRNLRNNGRTQSSLEMASFFEKMLCFNSKIKKANSPLIAKVLNEKGRCLIFLEKPSTLLSKVKENNNYALHVGLESKDLEIISMAHGNIGGSYYVAKQLKKSAEYLQKTLSLVNEDTRIEYIRTLLADYALLGNFNSYKKIYVEAEKILSESYKYNQSHVASIYESLSRSLALKGNINSAKNFLNAIDTSSLEPFYQSEIIRGKMFVCYQSYLRSKKIDIEEAEHILKEAKQKTFSAFQRHQMQIDKMYEEMSYGRSKNYKKGASLP